LSPRRAYDPNPVLADNGDVIVGMRVYNENNGLTDVYIQRANLDQELLLGENGIQLDTSSRYEAIIGVYKGDERQLFFPVSDNYNSRFILLPVALFSWANGMKP